MVETHLNEKKKRLSSSSGWMECVQREKDAAAAACLFMINTQTLLFFPPWRESISAHVSVCIYIQPPGKEWKIECHVIRSCRFLQTIVMGQRVCLSISFGCGSRGDIAEYKGTHTATEDNEKWRASPSNSQQKPEGGYQTKKKKEINFFFFFCVMFVFPFPNILCVCRCMESSPSPW